jgi:hypothetical protein
MSSLESRILALLPDSFSALKDQMNGIGADRTFTIFEYSYCNNWLDASMTLTESIDTLSLPAEKSTVDQLKDCANVLKTLTKIDLIRLEQWFVRRIIRLSETSFILFALQIEFSDVPKTDYKQFEIGGECLYSRLQFYEYKFYASNSDVNSLSYNHLKR